MISRSLPVADNWIDEDELDTTTCVRVGQHMKSCIFLYVDIIDIIIHHVCIPIMPDTWQHFISM